MFALVKLITVPCFCPRFTTLYAAPLLQVSTMIRETSKRVLALLLLAILFDMAVAPPPSPPAPSSPASRPPGTPGNVRPPPPPNFCNAHCRNIASAPVCGSNRIMYPSMCHLRRASCRLQGRRLHAMPSAFCRHRARPLENSNTLEHSNTGAAFTTASVGHRAVEREVAPVGSVRHVDGDRLEEKSDLFENLVVDN